MGGKERNIVESDHCLLLGRGQTCVKLIVTRLPEMSFTKKDIYGDIQVVEQVKCRSFCLT